METLNEYIKIFVAIIAVVNPLGALPMFLGFCGNQPEAVKRKTAKTTAVAVTVILVTSGLIGHYVLEFFGISIPSFRIGGGILLLLMAISMLQAKTPTVKQSPEEAAEAEGRLNEEAEGRMNIAVVPLAMPILSGPGTISTVILIAQQAATWVDYAIIIAACIVIGIIIYFVLRSSNTIAKILRRTGINILSRIMGILLAAIAIEFISKGVIEILKHTRL